MCYKIAEYEQVVLDDLENTDQGCKQRLIDAVSNIFQLIDADMVQAENIFQ